MSWPRKREYLYMAIAAFLAVIYATVGTMDFQDALIAEQMKHERFAPQAPTVTGQGSPYPPQPSPAVLSHPIPYKAIVCQAGKCVYYIGKPK